MFEFSYSYQKLGNDFFDPTTPDKVSNPQILIKNQELIKKLHLEGVSDNKFVDYLSGNKHIENTISTVYAGHQFGHFNPQLGDGRAATIGEIQVKNKVFDIQLKGCGRTKYSRNGDGKLALGPAIREYLVSEAMFYLGVKTTRCLAIVTTDDRVLRETPLQAAVLTRVLESNVRIGSFEYFKAREENKNIEKLVNYCINRNYSNIKDNSNKYLEFLQLVAKNQAKLVAKYMSLGFIHGVLNTDNMSISGEVIDYGPCAFLDEFDSGKVFSSIDAKGRYGYNNQASIIAWNLSSLGYCLSDFIPNAKENIEQVLSDFSKIFDTEYNQHIANKLGFEFQDGDEILIDELFKLMHKYKIDWTLFFKDLENDIYPNEFKTWYNHWRDRVKRTDYKPIMQKTNPFIIPRNHQIEDIINRAYRGDFEKFYQFNQVLKNPFVLTDENKQYSLSPKENERVFQTFCGT